MREAWSRSRFESIEQSLGEANHIGLGVVVRLASVEEGGSAPRPNSVVFDEVLPKDADSGFVAT